MLAHGAVLRKNGFSTQQIIAILEDPHKAGLEPVEVHLMDYAAKLSQTPPAITDEDVEILRRDGLTDAQISDVVLVTAGRNFMSRLFDGLGAGPDEELIAQEPELWQFLKDWKG